MILPQKNEKPKVSDSMQSVMTSLGSKLQPKTMAQSALGNSFQKTGTIPNLIGKNKPIQPEKNNKVGSVDSSFYTTVASGTSQSFRTGDTASTISTKYFGLIKTLGIDKKRKYDLERNFEKESDLEEKRKYKEILKKLDTKKEEKPKEETIQDSGGGGDLGLGLPKGLGKAGGKSGKGKAGMMAQLIGGSMAGVVGYEILEKLLGDTEDMVGLKLDDILEQQKKWLESTFGDKKDTPTTPTTSNTQNPTATQIPKSSSGDITSAIGGAESGGNYDVTFGDRVDSKTGKIINVNGNKTPEEIYGKKLTEMTLKEVKEFGQQRGNNGAAGKYQFMPSTLFGTERNPGGLVGQLKLTMDTKFTPEIQDKIQNLLRQQNTQSLKNQGVPITPGYEYMAHYIGSGGAAAVYNYISKNENGEKTVADVMADKKYPIGNNPELAKIKAKDFESVLAGRLQKQGLSGTHAGQEQTAKPVSSGFGQRSHPLTGQNSFHTGIDIPATPGTPVNSTKSGRVIVAGLQPGADKKQGYGNLVVVDHGNGVATRYAHLSSIDVKVGDEVTEGQKLGGVGSTGSSTGPHLHYEILQQGKPVDPLTNALSQVNPVGQVPTQEVAQNTGEKISSISTENRNLRNQDNVVATNNPKATTTGSVSKPRTLIAPNVQDYPLVAGFVGPHITR